MTHIAIDERLASDTLRLSAYKTMEKAIEEALTAFIASRREAEQPRQKGVGGYQRLLKYRKTLHRHVDYKKELEEARDEKYNRPL
jgi:Arc/MetJ family transcription regulator